MAVWASRRVAKLPASLGATLFKAAKKTLLKYKFLFVATAAAWENTS